MYSLKNFKHVKINTEHVEQIENTPSGIALIAIDDNGKNSIIVVPGANACLLPKDIDKAEKDIQKAGVVVAQLEIPIETIEHTACIAKKHSVTFILDPAPARPLSKELLAMVDILKPNEIEVGDLTGIKVIDRNTASKAAKKLLDSGVKTVIITLGDKGLIIADQKDEKFIERITVKAVDSTAARDSFTGALAFGIAQGHSIIDSARYANYVAALSVTKFGAQSSMPTKDQVDEYIA